MAKKKETKTEPTEVEKLQKQIETFSKKAEDMENQLSQSLELNEKIVTELEGKEKELQLFQEVKNSLEHVIEEQQNQIYQLQNELETFKSEQRRGKILALAQKWIEKYNLPKTQTESVVQMLTKFQDEKDLEQFENILGFTKGNVKINPVALTKSSAEIEQFTAEKPDRSELSHAEYIDLLHKKLENVRKTKGDL